jgi:RNA 2',3'-cyclic 3'-phosphodiesterase
MPRLFLAIDLPPPLRARLADLCQGVSGARWLPEEQLHLTVRFLGGVEEAALPGLRRALAGVRASAFRLAVAGVGTFPPASGRGAARVLWAGVAPPEPLLTLRAAIDEALGPDPEAAARGFSPHVTLARFRDRPGPELPAFLEAHARLASEPFPVDAFHLYESQLGPRGARHTRLLDVPLAPVGVGSEARGAERER